MRFVLYTEKTVAQCLTAINARMQVKGTASRPALDGWVEKGGTFSISVTAPVIGKFSRRTALKARAERESGITVIHGAVSNGVSREGQAAIFVALVLVALAMIGSGSVLLGLLLIPFAAYLYIPLHGDYLNSAVLLDEVEKTLKAKAKPPKKATTETKTAKSSTTSAATKRPTASKPAAASKTLAAGKTPTARKPAAPKARPAAAEPATAGLFPDTNATPAASKPAASARAATQASFDTDLADASEFPPMSDDQP